MNIRKILQASAFSSIVLNFTVKAVLHFLLIMLRYIYRAFHEKSNWQLPTHSTLKENRGNTKNISFQFHYGQFSQQKYSTRFYYYWCVTTWRRREISALSQKLEKVPFWESLPWLWSSTDKISHLKCIFKVFLGGKTRRFFPAGPVFLVIQMNVYQSTLIPRKSPCPDKFLVNSAKFLGSPGGFFFIEHIKENLEQVKRCVLYCLPSIQGALRKR